MAYDPLQGIKDAEKEIEKRHRGRSGVQLDFRTPAALELIADDMTRLHAEIKTIRNILASMAASRAG